MVTDSGHMLASSPLRIALRHTPPDVRISAWIVLPVLGGRHQGHVITLAALATAAAGKIAGIQRLLGMGGDIACAELAPRALLGVELRRQCGVLATSIEASDRHESAFFRPTL